MFPGGGMGNGVRRVCQEGRGGGGGGRGWMREGRVYTRF